MPRTVNPKSLVGGSAAARLPSLLCFLCRWNSIHEYGLGTFTMSGQTSNCGQKPADMPFPSASSSFRNVLKLRGRHVVVPGRWTVPANILFINFISCWCSGSWTVRWLLHMCQASRNRVMSIYSNMWCKMVDHNYPTFITKGNGQTRWLMGYVVAPKREWEASITSMYRFQCLAKAKVTFAQSDYKSDLRLARLANTAVPLECLSSCTGSSSYIYILYIPRDALRKTLRGFMGQQWKKNL